MPAFQHACFISYRHGQSEVKRRFLEQFSRALSDELELLRNQEPFVDMQRLQGGDFFNQGLARALYGSATFVLVYQPNYFDLNHPYCAREYRAMCALEKERLSQLPNPEDRDHGLIVPVILRGPNGLPDELTTARQYEDFRRFMLMDDEISRHPLYAPRVRAIAEYIDRRCKCLESAQVRFDDVDAFQLPETDQTLRWIQSLDLPRVGFPGVREV